MSSVFWLAETSQQPISPTNWLYQVPPIVNIDAQITSVEWCQILDLQGQNPKTTDIAVLRQGKNNCAGSENHSPH
jgi:hypothetical protein